MIQEILPLRDGGGSANDPPAPARCSAPLACAPSPAGGTGTQSELETIRVGYGFHAPARVGYLESRAVMSSEQLGSEQGVPAPSLVRIPSHSLEAPSI